MFVIYNINRFNDILNQWVSALELQVTIIFSIKL